MLILVLLSALLFAQTDPAALFKEAEALRASDTEESLRAAIDKYRLALPLFQAAGDGRRVGETLFYLGLCRSALGDKGGALDDYLRALPLRRAAGDRVGEAQTLNNIGVVYDYLGEDQKALGYYRDSLALKRELGDRRGEAATLGNIGMIYSSLGEKEEALAYHRQALEIRRAAGDRAGQAIILHNIGLVYASLGEKKKALDYYQQSLAIRRDIKDRRGESGALNSIGAIYSALGQQKKALPYLEAALAIKRDIGDRIGEAYTLQYFGSLYESLGKKEEALDAYRRALEIRRAARQRSGEANSLASMAHVERDRGDLHAAREHIGEALSIIEALRSKLAVPDVRASYFGSTESYYDFFIDLLMRLGEPVAAFEASERARARSLLDVLHEAGTEIREGADPDLLRREESARRRIVSAERQHRGDDQLRQLLAEAAEIEAQIRLQSPRYAALTQPVPLSLAEIQRDVLDEDTVLLEYSLGKERSFVWLVTRKRFAAFALPKQSRIDAAARHCRELLIDSDQRAHQHEAQRAATRLGSMLLGPVASHLGRKRLLIVADGSLQIVPFAALRVPLPLILDHEIVNAPSASVIGVLRREIEGRPPAARRVAILADPEFGPALNRLPASRREAEAIARLVPPAEALTALGSDASRDLATSGELAKYRIIHFATHAIVDDKHPDLSAVALSRGMLQMYDIYNLRLNADLVALSACETALGKQIRGEGLIGLVRGFMYAGSPRVLASLWKVKDQATANLMRSFYEAMLARGAPPAAALRTAQLAMLRDARWQAPSYWAGFILQGDWR